MNSESVLSKRLQVAIGIMNLPKDFYNIGITKEDVNIQQDGKVDIITTEEQRIARSIMSIAYELIKLDETAEQSERARFAYWNNEIT